MKSKITVEEVKRYFNTFASNNPGYTFIVAKKFTDLYDVCITAAQCSDIKATLERRFGLTGYLDEAPSQEVSPREYTTRSFRNTQDFRRFREHTLAEMNRPVIREKHAAARQHYNKVQDLFASRKEAFQILCFDIEVYEHDRSIMLEIGYVVCRFLRAVGSHFGRMSAQAGKPDINLVAKRHFIISENLHYKNKDRVPDNRYGFRFGVSETLSIANAVREFAKDISACDSILGHSVQHDEAYLKNIGVDLSLLRKEMFDTQVIQTYKESIVDGEKYFMRGLSYMLKEFKLNYQESQLHNAGVDAFYTMMVFLRQMEYSAEQVNAIIASHTGR